MSKAQKTNSENLGCDERVDEALSERDQKLKDVQETLNPGDKAFYLPSGRLAVIYKGKGRHSIEAHRIIEGDSSLYLPALMAVLTTIDGEGLVLEEITEMDLADYHTLQANFSESNFS